MFDTIVGLPVHALVVHAVVVLLPLAVLGTLAMALVPRWSRRYGWLVVAVTLVGAGSAFVARQSGEALAARVGTPADHFDVARWLPWFALGLLAVVVTLWWLDRGANRTGRPAAARGAGTKLLAAVAALVALVTLVWTVRAGDSGARAVWEHVVQTTSGAAAD